MKWAWVRMKMIDGNAVKPFVYELVIGEGWGDSSNVVSTHTDRIEAVRLADFHNKIIMDDKDQEE